MPSKTDNIKIDCPFIDRRVKLLPCQKEMVVYYYNKGFSQRKIAKMFNVSRRLIVFIIYPDRLIKNYEARLDNGGSAQYYKGGKEWATTVRTHRQYKKSLFKNLNS